MKRASHSNGLIFDDGKFIGIALGYDYCAEHEWGIDGLKRLFGMPRTSAKNIGIKCRTITIVPPIIFKEHVVNKGSMKIKKGKYAILYTKNKYVDNEILPYPLHNWVEELNLNFKWNSKKPDSKNDNIITAWDDESFGVGVMGEDEVEYLKELKTAIDEKRLTIAVTDLRKRNPFAGSSLCLLITDRIPQETIDIIYNEDKEYFDREKYEEKIGMKKIIDKYGNKNGFKGLHYFLACSPKWIDYHDKENREKEKKRHNTKYDIIYCINYSDDDENRGWYSAEEIKEWLTGNKKLTEIRKG